MYHPHGYMEKVSTSLSQVLADAGVNEKIVMKRRRKCLLHESLFKISQQLIDEEESMFNFGSQSEGTTTPGLDSDYDYVFVGNAFNVLQDWSDWEPGFLNYWMIQDETVSPGYCLLEQMSHDVPLPYDHNFYQYHSSDRRYRLQRLLENAFLSPAADAPFGRVERHGPAHFVQGNRGTFNTDFVYALPCKTWPQQAGQWPVYQCEGQRHLNKIKRFCSQSGCFVVGVGCKGSENEKLEWRISTSLAERALMFNLNMTQIQCYVLMKMILNDFINPFFKDNISSFMCECILFHCIRHTRESLWREHNLLECFSLYLVVLYNCILSKNCPHVFIPENNLMKGHITPADKPCLLDILRKIINSEGKALLEIKCDIIGDRLQEKLFHSVDLLTCNDFISGLMIMTTSKSIHGVLGYHFKELSRSTCQDVVMTLYKQILHLVTNINQCQQLDKKACCLLLPWLCTTLGSTLASLNIQQNNAISAEAFTWMSLGLKTDVASSKLKLASMLYCIGDFQRAERVIMDIEKNYEMYRIEPVCSDYSFTTDIDKRALLRLHNNEELEAEHFKTAPCIRFLPCEINCVPPELQQEMFRCTQEDLVFRDKDEWWMDWAVVDCLSFLYFLHYKIYNVLGKQNKKEAALSNLIRTIDQYINLAHRETALNLLGKCMEQEDRLIDALQCYQLSLNEIGNNNAAKFHICKLLSNMIQNR